MGMLRWAAPCAVMTIVVCGGLVGDDAILRPDGATLASTHYLAERYKAAPAETAEMVRLQTAACLADRLGNETTVELASFIGELVLHAIRRADRDQQAFRRHYRTLAEGDGPVVDGWAAGLPKSQKRRIAILVDDLAGGPHAIAQCVAAKLRTATPPDGLPRAIVQEIPGLRDPA